MKTGAPVAAFARPVRLRPVDRRSTPSLSPIAPRTSSLAVQTQRRRLRRTRPERSAWLEPEPTSSGPWQPRGPILPDDRDFGPAMARLTNGSASSWMSVLRPQADCGGASSRLQQSRARCEQVRTTAAIFFAKTKMGFGNYSDPLPRNLPLPRRRLAVAWRCDTRRDRASFQHAQGMSIRTFSTATSRYPPVRTTCARPNASFASVLLI